MSRYRPGENTLKNLDGVLPLMVRAVLLAYEYTEQDFCIIDNGGLRSPTVAAANAASGVGVVNSLHIRQPDGYGHAVDLVAYEGGPRWPKSITEIERLYAPIHSAMFRACDEVGLLIQNGADWNNNGITGEKKEWDWPHFQTPKYASSIAAARAAMERRIRERGQGLSPYITPGLTPADMRDGDFAP